MELITAAMLVGLTIEWNICERNLNEYEHFYDYIPIEVQDNVFESFKKRV